MSNQIQLRRDTALAWSTINPILAQGEVGVELSSSPSIPHKTKIGDGVNHWASLPYQNDSFSGAILGANDFTGKQTAPEMSSIFLDKYISSSSSGAVSLNLSQKGVFDITTSGAVSVSFDTPPSLTNEILTFVVRVSQGATAYSISWPGSITWLTSTGTAPAAPAANKTIEYVFTTTNGTLYVGRKGASN